MKNINTMNGKRLLLSATIAFLLLLMINPVANAQVGIGISNPDASAALDVTSTTQGFLMPRMTTAQRGLISSPATGLMVIDTDLKTVMIYNGAEWVEVGGGVKQQAETGIAQNEEITLTGVSSVVGVWEEQSSGTSSTSGNVNYETAVYNLENSTYVTVADGTAKMIATVPVYSTDICTGGTPFGDEDAIQVASLAFDNNNTTFFKSFTTLKSDGTVKQSLGYEFTQAKIATKYTFRTGENIGNTPKDWTFEGWNGIAWVVLDTKINQVPTLNSVNSYTISNSTAYTKYRLLISEVGSNSWKAILYEFEIMETLYEYQTTTAYYVTTQAASNIDATNGLASINDIVFTGASGLSDSRFALSFDGGGTWKKYNAGSWVDIALADVDVNGNTQSELEGLTTIAIAGNSIDVAVALKATNATTNAILGNVEVTYSYNTGTFYKKMDESDFQIRRTNATGKQNIIVKKLSAGTDKNVVIDYIK